MRKKYNFNTNWFFAKNDTLTDNAAFISNQESWEPMTLPHTWNAADGQDGGDDYYRGTCQYVKKFMPPALNYGERLVLEFEGAAMAADVFVNGQKTVRHEGGYSTFRTDITDLVVTDAENFVSVLVDNGRNDRIYPQKADFTFYGGLYRNVNLLVVPEKHFELIKDGSSGIKVTPEVLENRKVKITLESWQNTDGSVRFEVYAPNGCGLSYWRTLRAEASLSSGAEESLKPVDWETADAELMYTVSADSVNGYAKAEVILDNAKLWEGILHPYLYAAKAVLENDEEAADSVTTRFGCRSTQFKADTGFFLNGNSYPLRGVSRHQDRAGVGNALTDKMHEEDLDIILDIGANTVRLAHYQQAQYFYDLCDEAGLVVWAEIPYITQHMPNGRENTLTQMRELVVQNYNHPSIVCWGLSNEITASGEVSEDLMENHRLLNDLCHRIDATRPTTMAHVFMLETDSPLINIADIGSYNLYFGWYLGELSQNDDFFDKYHREYPDRVIGFSEYGADANPQYQSETPERGDYTESYQCLYHEHILSCIEERPYLWATHVWNLFDFAADGREEGGKKGVNQKGLVTIDRKEKKDAYYLYKAHWSKTPFVHLCGKRFVDRTGDETEIRVYSNCPKVTLYVNGKTVETKTNASAYTFRVPIAGEMQVEVVASDIEGNTLSDHSVIRKAEKKNPDYAMAGQAEIVNWFDRDTLDPTCYSIEDTNGDLNSNPEVKQILAQFMIKAIKSRGEVAESSRSNANMEAMMAKMKFSAMLKMVANIYTPEEIQELNRKLQSIRKTV